MDTTQLLLVIVLFLTTIFLIVVGVQITLTLMEVRKTLRSLHNVIEGFEAVGINVNQSFHEIAGFVNGFKTLLRLMEVASNKKNEPK